MRTSDQTQAGVAPSPGLVLAPFANGAAVFDPFEEKTHLVGPVAAWLLGTDEPIVVDELVDLLADETDVDEATARSALEAAVATLVDLGLLGRDEALEAPARRIPTIDRPEEGWTVGASHGIIDGHLAFCGPDAEVIAAADELLGSPAPGVEPTVYFGLIPDGSGAIDLIDDSRWHFPTLGQLLWQLPGVVNDTVSHLHSMAILHAGAVRTPGGRIILVTGPMNTGKSTLVAALLAAGCDYLGDESIGIDPSSQHAWSHPKPLTLDPTSQQLVGLDPLGEPFTAGEHRRPQEIRPGTVSLHGDAGPLDLVVSTAYRPAAPPESVRLDPQRTLELLLMNTLNLLRSGAPGLATLCRVAEHVPAVSFVHGDSVALAEQLVAAEADPDRSITGTPATGDASEPPSE